MKVTIDTKEDSHDDIRKVLGILTHILKEKDHLNSVDKVNFSKNSYENDHEIYNDNYENGSAGHAPKLVDSTNMMSMFGGDSVTSSNSTIKHDEIRDTAPDFTSLMNLTRKEQKKDDEPKIEWL
jgi:hypothetical protein